MGRRCFNQSCVAFSTKATIKKDNKCKLCGFNYKKHIKQLDADQIGMELQSFFEANGITAEWYSTLPEESSGKSAALRLRNTSAKDFLTLLSNRGVSYKLIDPTSLLDRRKGFITTLPKAFPASILFDSMLNTIIVTIATWGAPTVNTFNVVAVGGGGPK